MHIRKCSKEPAHSLRNVEPAWNATPTCFKKIIFKNIKYKNTHPVAVALHRGRIPSSIPVQVRQNCIESREGSTAAGTAVQLLA